MKISNKIVLLFLISMFTACADGGGDLNSKHLPPENTLGANKESAEKSVVSIESCAACHGQNGISKNTDWPNLAGQQLDYLYQQLRLFRDGKRENAIMSASLLQNFSDQDLRSIAKQYNKMATVTRVDENASELPGAHVRARCVSCHSMTGKSVTSLWPNIGGQQAGYLANQLMAYKTGDRVHPTMQVIASELTEKQMKDVAEYYSKVSP